MLTAPECQADRATSISPAALLCLQDFQGHLFCLPMSDDFHVKVKRILKQTGLAKLPDNKWRFAVASSVHQKRVPFVCSIWVYVAAVRDKGS